MVLLDIWVKSPFGVTRPYDCTVVCRHRFNLESVQGENFERAGFTPPHVKRAVPAFFRCQQRKLLSWCLASSINTVVQTRLGQVFGSSWSFGFPLWRDGAPNGAEPRSQLDGLGQPNAQRRRLCHVRNHTFRAP